LWQLPLSARTCAGILKRRRADALFSMGGFVAGPAVLAGVWLRIPVVAMEPNAMPGFVHRVMARWIDFALLGMPGAAAWFPEGRSAVTGVPVRAAFFAAGAPAAGKQVVLITGGSQGSRTLNRAFREAWPLFAAHGPAVRFLHQSGAGEAEALARDLAATGLDGAVSAFVADMPGAFGQASLIVGRAGANAVAEIAAAGKPAILVPFPFAADDHQTANARALEQAGAAVLIADAELDGKRLHEAIAGLMQDPQRLERMGLAARALARPDAAAKAADVLEEAAKRYSCLLTRGRNDETIRG
jgi:UDP-N-acetylglucosamine--N-acetylmuramyl-(pentapeptide) pyrophosphoryl-undecaprenol N-acetylglucosamine transferase